MQPVLYSFRRCPYAMRARFALHAANVRVDLCEVVLRDKPAAFLDASPSGTVPCLVLPDRVVDESLDIMIWALQQHDPFGWLKMPNDGFNWIDRCDGAFKAALDRTKYATRFPDSDPQEARDQACVYLRDLDRRIHGALFGEMTLADVAIFPFVRQFAFIDKNWFDSQPWPNLHRWLAQFLESQRFQEIMHKYNQWHEGDEPVRFPPETVGDA